MPSTYFLELRGSLDAMADGGCAAKDGRAVDVKKNRSDSFVYEPRRSLSAVLRDGKGDVVEREVAEENSPPST